jgi:hypothetical protein
MEERKMPFYRVTLLRRVKKLRSEGTNRKIKNGPVSYEVDRDVTTIEATSETKAAEHFSRNHVSMSRYTDWNKEETEVKDRLIHVEPLDNLFTFSLEPPTVKRMSRK